MTAFRFRDALRDLVHAPRAATFVIAAAIAIVAAPLLYSTVFAARAIAHADDGRAAFKLYELWLVRAIVLGAFTARIAGAVIASTMVESFDRPSVSLAESVARTLSHGVPALLAAALALALTGLGVIAAVVAALPLAAATFVAGPAAGAEQRGPRAAIRRSAELTRGARLRLGAWIAALIAIEIAPLVIVRFTIYKASAKKPPLAPILHAQQVHGAIVIAVAVIAALVQVAVYRRLRDQTLPPMPNPNVQ